jgi:hypothetical protein
VFFKNRVSKIFLCVAQCLHSRTANWLFVSLQMKLYKPTHCDKTAVSDPGAGCVGSALICTLCTMETEATGFTRSLAQSRILQGVRCQNMVVQIKKLEGIRYSLFHCSMTVFNCSDKENSTKLSKFTLQLRKLEQDKALNLSLYSASVMLVLTFPLIQTQDV